MARAPRRVFVVGPSYSPQINKSSRNRIQVALRSLTQLHSYRGRRDVVLRLDAESWCLSIRAMHVREAEPVRLHRRGWHHEGREGLIPSSITKHRYGSPLLNNDRVVQRRRAGQRCHNRPAPSSHSIKPSMRRWDAGSDVGRVLGVPETRTGFVRFLTPFPCSAARRGRPSRVGSTPSPDQLAALGLDGSRDREPRACAPPSWHA